MSTSSIKLAGVALTLALLGGCASKPPQSVDIDIGDGTAGPSRYAEQRAGAAAGESDAEHIPPVPHDPAVAGIAEEAIPEYARALQTMRAGDLDRALVMFSSLASRYPRLSGPAVNQGIILSRQGKHAEAEQALRQALTANALNPYAHNALGVALREQGKFAEARNHYETAVALDPKYARAHFNLGVLAELYLQDITLALTHFRAYQALQRQQDQTVANWIADLERRVPDASPTPGAFATPAESGTREEELN
jgi:Flp pilus assembly protein TadD